ncbi:hypothetical protein CDL15_Pgr002318 [Punica granatum]|uniref:Cytochrome P450 CYP72A219-like n=1 Tax=Punica granatum TaxID=22663 RepID=A0A218XVL2_PUNGR|nr:hypothetical protein CDL15_Pgr002318 [Punica granatum]PKI54286.1 hypothetical protein CRG98_025346 [Punica granatum]
MISGASRLQIQAPVASYLMELSVQSFAVAVICVLTVTLTWMVLNWLWLRPKKLEKCLRQQGLTGNSYRFLFGDTKEISRSMKQALSAPITLSDDICPRSITAYHSVKKHGKDSFVWIGPRPRVTIMKPEQLRVIFNNLEDFQKEDLVPLVKLLANGLASHNGQKWAKHRKLVNPAFHLECLKNMVPLFYASCSEMINEWENMVSGEGSPEFDVWPYLENLTGDVISRTAFGSSYKEGRKIFQLQKEQCSLATEAMRSFYIPGWRLLPTKLNRRMKKIDMEMRSLIKGMISKREEAMKTGESMNKDLLSLLVGSNMKELTENWGHNNVGMSTTDVIEECKLFYLAGKETTTSLVVWALIFLSTHQQWQARARGEVQEIFGNKKPDFEGISLLKILSMILYEVLRLYPPQVTLVRTVQKKTEIGGLSLPPGVLLYLPTILIHRDRELWGDDAEEFKPERFSEGISKATKGRVSYFPFGWGPRLCVGEKFALLEAKMSLVLILQHFEFELSPLYIHAPVTVISLQPEHGAHVVFRKVTNCCSN